MDSTRVNIPERFALIEAIAMQLNNRKFSQTRLGDLEVVLYRNVETVSTGPVGLMLLYLIGDMWIDGDTVNIRGVNKAVVRCL